MSFPNNFLWGASTAAHQIEGAYNEDGKVPGIWDALYEGHTRRNENGNVACDHYHRFKEDVSIMKELGLKSYRFSVSWPRVITDKKGTVNEKGIAFYKALVSELRAAGIEPLCTIFHWNLPMWAYERGGWKNEEIVSWFCHYVHVLMEALSDQVSYWMTINEPQCFVGNGYKRGDHAPFEQCDDATIARITRNVLLAHGEAVKLIRREAKLPPKIGMAPTSFCVQPASERAEEIDRAYETTFSDRAGASGTSWWCDPAILGTIPAPLQGVISEEDIKTICQPLDFYGFNSYAAANYYDRPGGNPLVTPGLPRTVMGTPVTPEKYKRILLVSVGPHPSPILARAGMGADGSKLKNQLKEKLEARGFAVTGYVDPVAKIVELMQKGGDEATKLLSQKGNKGAYGLKQSVSALTDNYDLVLCYANVSSTMRTTQRLEWAISKGGWDNPWYVNEIPTIFVSFNCPFHLVDVPQIKTFVNCYDANEATVDASLDKLEGKSGFVGVSPVDAFCGMLDTRF